MLKPTVHLIAPTLALALAIHGAAAPPTACAQLGVFLESWPVQGPPLGLALDGGGNVLVTSAQAAAPI